MKKRIVYLLVLMILLSKVGMGQSISFSPPYSFQYDAAPHRPNDNIVCSAFSGYSVTRTYTDDLGNVVLSPVNVGSYTVTVVVSGGCSLSLSQNFVITKAPLTITASNSLTKTYGSTLATPVNSSIDFSVSGNYEAIGTVTLSFLSGALNATDLVGSTSVVIPSDPIAPTLGLFNANNYNINFINGLLTVTTKPLTITAVAKSKIYGDVNPALTFGYTGLVNGDVKASLEPVPATTATTNSNVGTYSITLSGSSDPNYTINYVGANFEITKKPITVTARASQTKVYGDANPTTYQYDLNTSISGLAILNGTLTRLSGEDVGTYAIQQNDLTTANNPNYTINYVGNNFFITPAPLTIKNITGATKVYDGTTTASINGTAAYDGLVAADAGLATVQGGPSFNFDNKDAGVNKPITVTGYIAPSSNYVLTQPTGLTASITPAPITIAGITGVSRAYDRTTNATVTGAPVYTGLVAGENLTVVGSPTYSFANKNVGTAKPITVSGFTAPNANYTLSAQPTGITADINPKLLTITVTIPDRMYDASKNTPGLNLSIDPILGDIVNISKTGALFDNANAGVNKDIFVTGLSINNGDDGANYYLASTTATVKGTIKPLQINIVAIDATKTELDPDPPFTYQPVSLLGTDVFTGSLSRFPGESPGDYPITIGSLSAGNNYLLNLNSAKLTIKPLVTNYIFEVPNAFTPNLDGTNDVLKIIKNYRVTGLNYFRIYNRTGQLVFETRTLTEGWNGRRMGDLSGNILESDLYIWVAEFTNMNDVGPVKKSGTVLLLK